MAVSFKGAHFPKDIILMGVRWYVAYPPSTRHIEELLRERDVPVDHSTINRWVRKYSYGVYQSWQGLRQSCLAPLLRTAKGLTESMEAGITRFGKSVCRDPTAVSYGDRAAHGWPVAGLVCAFQASSPSPHCTSGHSWEIGSTFRTGSRVAVDVSRRPWG